MATENVESVEELIAELHEQRRQYVICGGRRAGRGYLQELVGVKMKLDTSEKKNAELKRSADTLRDNYGWSRTD